MHPPSFIVSLSPSLSTPATVSRSRWVICPSLTSTCLPNPHRSFFSRGRLWQLPVAHCVCASHLISVSVSQTIGILNVKGSFVFFFVSQTMSVPAEKGKAGAQWKGGFVLMRTVIQKQFVGTREPSVETGWVQCTVDSVHQSGGGEGGFLVEGLHAS